MFTNHPILDNFDYICAQNAPCWARITKSDMNIQRYNRLKAASKRVQSEVSFDSAEWEQARPQVKIVLAEKEKTGTWLSEQMGHHATNGTQELYEIARHLDVDVKELLVSSK